MLFLITCVIDEGVYDSSFIVVEAESELEIAEHMLSDTSIWEWFLDRAYPHDWQQRQRKFAGSLMDCIRSNPAMSPQELLDLINITSVDGDSTSQLRIHPITVRPLTEVETDPWKREDLNRRSTGC
ncbi:MAG: hypothetical protein HWQ41_00655 [Nostoc sp. NOS(2021)]|uniref:hypothetical protein n=1 Tax=Nostoc sp. NOS(2021) TaxID=2815407 RepID=UPI0025E82074|nr:hypothetical protein [Nostoc sp. NOS(2021)]MBN3893853.1 hypothetical protein [Nostoc sp. NOS(2021)]